MWWCTGTSSRRTERAKSAEGAAFNSHGRKAVVRVVEKIRGPKGRHWNSAIIEMSHLRRSDAYHLIRPRPDGRGYLMTRLRRSSFALSSLHLQWTSLVEYRMA